MEVRQHETDAPDENGKDIQAVNRDACQDDLRTWHGDTKLSDNDVEVGEDDVEMRENVLEVRAWESMYSLKMESARYRGCCQRCQ